MATVARKPYPPIPYGMADFRSIRRDGFLYVDKTRFVRELENERFAFFLRPRRFGKTCWISVLEHYYDRTRKDGFEATFAETDIGREPTANRSRYAVLRLNFSAFSKRLATLEERFEGHCYTRLRGMLEANVDLFPRELAGRILSPRSIEGRLGELFLHAERLGARLFLLIDEYDYFANGPLSGTDEAAYRQSAHGAALLRDFFATVKAGTESGNLERLFITGVLPVTLDDVTSGFNIGTNISFRKKYNAMMGFTEAEVRELVDAYRELGVFDQDADAALAVMREWYSGYRFAKDAVEDVYNTNMVLYYLKHSVPNKCGPADLVDDKVREDYRKVRHFVMSADTGHGAKRMADSGPPAAPQMPGSSSNGGKPLDAKRTGLNLKFDVLHEVLAEGFVDSTLDPSLAVEKTGEGEHLLTLLHCLGLLSVIGVVDGRLRLGIPNQTVRELMRG